MWPASEVPCLLVRAESVTLLLVASGREPAVLGRAALRSRMDQPPALQLVEALRELGESLSSDSAIAPLQRQGRALQVLVSARWLPAQVLSWSDALARVSTARRHAADLLAAAGFEPTLADEIRICEGGYRRPAVAVMYPRRLIDALEQFALRLGFGLSAIVPLQSAVRVCLRAEGLSAIAVGDGPHGSILEIDGDTVMWMPGQMQTGPANEAPGHMARRLARRLLLRKPVFRADQVGVVDLDADVTDGWSRGTQREPAMGQSAAERPILRDRIVATCLGSQARSSLDLTFRTARMTPAQSLVAALSISVATLSVVVASWARPSEAKWTRLAGPGYALVESAATTPTDRARVKAVNAAIRELNLPLDDLATSLSPPRDVRVGMVSLALASAQSADRRSTLLLTADARSAIDMTRYIAYLADRSAIQRPTLVSHQVMEGEPGRPYRFSVEMTWRN